MSPQQRPRPGGAPPAGKSHSSGYSAPRSGPAWERRGHDGGRRRHRRRRAPGSSRRRTWLTVGFAVVAVALLGALVAVIRNLNEDEPDTVDLGPTTTLDPSTLSAEGQELYSLVEASQSSTYHVVFSVVSPDLANAGAAAQLEVWRMGEQFRDQRVGVDATGQSITVVIGGPDGTVSCGGGVGAAPTCAASDDDAALDTALAQVVALLPDGDTTAADATVADLPARCFTITSGDKNAIVCLTADGIPLAIDDGSVRFEASVVDTTVDPAILVLPAEGAEPPPANTVPPPAPPPTTAPAETVPTETAPPTTAST